MSAVSIKDISVSFGDAKVLDGISLDIEVGEIVAIMGSSGGGKTTLLRCISGLLKPTKGHVVVEDIDVQRSPDEARRKMGMVFQSAALFDYLSVEDNVAFGLRRWSNDSKKDQKTQVDAALEKVDLQDARKKMPSELSGGMRKRVGVARAIVLKPKVMLYDEPTTGLDPITTYNIDHLMVKLRDELQITSLIVSHDVSSVFRTADRIAFLEKGRLSYIGDKSGFEASADESIAELVGKSRASSFETWK